ncbi:MFS transporter [Microlunatus sp. Gsoil 973]|uniref:MFS transporter n=1 Tax=Microlunatus sp. Gsoil 973 TaxID=2672569 RepID=UPI00351BC40C
MKEVLRSSLWAVRDLRVVLVARTASAAGTAVTSVTALLLIHDSGLGPYGVAGLLACLFVPVILTMGLAGRVADRADSRRVLVMTALLQAACCAAVTVLPRPAVLYPAVGAVALAQAFAQPTWSALVPRIVGEDRIGRAVAWQQGLNAISAPVGSAVGGLLVGLGLARWGFGVDALSYLLLALAAAAVRTRRRVAPSAGQAVSRGWAEGLKSAGRDPIVRPLFATILIFVILVEGINPVEVFLVRDTLGGSPFQYGLSEFFGAAGAVAGAGIAGRVAGVSGRVMAACAGFGAAAVGLVAAAVSPGFWMYALTLVVLSGGFGVGNATFGALLVSRTPDADRGKVYAALGGLANAAKIIALAVGSSSLLFVAPRVSFLAAGVAGALVMAVAGVSLRQPASRAAQTVAVGQRR